MSIFGAPEGASAFSVTFYRVRASRLGLHHGPGGNGFELLNRVKDGRLDLPFASGLQYSNAIRDAVESEHGF